MRTIFKKYIISYIYIFIKIYIYIKLYSFSSI